MAESNKGYTPSTAASPGWLRPRSTTITAIRGVLGSITGHVPSDGDEVGGYTRLAPGESGWHRTLNQNFARIESDMRAIATAIETAGGPQLDVPTLAQPSKGAVGWHRPINSNFAAIERFVTTADAALEQLESG